MLVSAVNVTVGPNVRFITDSASCGDTSEAIVLAPSVTVNIDPATPLDARPIARTDSLAADSASYLHIADAWWADLTRAAHIVLPRDARMTPAPLVSGGRCANSAGNWGDPAALSPCVDRTPTVYAPGDLTIDGGVGQGVLLVDGQLVIAGPFAYSGQIVARHGIETRADNITISGRVYAWRASENPAATRATANELMLTHTTTLRASRCDARHGVASWLRPRRVRERASTELF
jgi:hypothetical protein